VNKQSINGSNNRANWTSNLTANWTRPTIAMGSTITTVYIRLYE